MWGEDTRNNNNEQEEQPEVFLGSRGLTAQRKPMLDLLRQPKGENGMMVLDLSLFFLLSPLGAYILLRFLKAPPLLKICTCRASGAIGGLLTVHGMLFGSYHKNASPGLTKTDNVSPKLRDAMIVVVAGEGYAL